MAVKNRPIIIVAGVVVWLSLLAWFSFHPVSGQHFEQNTPLLVVLAVAGVAPLYPLYKLAKRWPTFLGGIILVAILGVITSVYIVAHYLLGLKSVWVERISDLSDGLLIVAIILLVWGGRHKARLTRDGTDH